MALLGSCLLLSTAVTRPCAAQTSEAQGVPTLKSTSRNVILDVVVTDAHGQPVRGLAANDFTITENGAPQKIRLVDTSSVSADEVSGEHFGSRIEEQAFKQRSGPGAMRTVILLDEVNVQFFDLAFARQRLEAFLRSDKAAGQPIAVMTMSQRTTALVHDFTTDRSALLKAVHAIPAVLTATGEGGQINGNVGYLQELENFRRAVGVLEQLSSALKGTTDHINVLWITSGFPGLTQMTVSGEVESTLDNLLSGTSNLFLEARLTLYTIDPHGVQIESSLPNHNGQIFQGNPGGAGGATNINTGEELAGNVLNLSNTQAVANSMLGKLDQRTGGRMYGNMNDIDIPIAMAMEEGASAYRVAYSPSDKNFDGRYRKIKVKISRPGLMARTRDGYFALAEPGAPSRADRKLRLEEALESPFLYEGLRVSGTLTAAAAGSAVDVIVESAGLTRTYDASGTHRKVMVAMAAYSAGNRVLGSQVWEVEAKGGKAEGAAVRYSLPYPLPAGTARLRVAVLDANGDRVGTSEVSLHRNAGG